jgi:hypothetical protein
MHQQVRVAPRISPADLAALLQVLADKGINVLSAGGSHIEEGGEFAFSVHLEDPGAGIDDDRTEEAAEVLIAAGYRANIEPVFRCFRAPGEEGGLLSCIQEARAAGHGGLIRDVAVGVPISSGEVPIQLFIEP